MTLDADDSNRPLVERVPPPNFASPTDLQPRDPRDVRWYKPGIEETLKLMGWRWLYFLPISALVVLVIWLPRGMLIVQLWAFWWKLVLLAVALPVGAFFTAARNSVRMRKEPFCIHCGYELTNLPDNYNCPECGEHYTFRVINEYRRDPAWFIQRYKNRGAIPSADVPFMAGDVRRKKSRDGTA